MRVATIDNRLCVIRPEGAVDIATVTGGEFPADPAGLMARWDDFRAWAAAHAAELEAAPAAEYQSADLDAPVPCPSQIFAIGLNYRDHAAEAGLDLPQGSPVVFAKFSSSVVGPHAEVVLPSDAVDFEAELVVVIGRGGHGISRDEAWDHVAGLTLGQDLSERLVQWRGPSPQFSLGKSYPGFSPVGPVIVTPEEFPDRESIALGCTLNGESMQDGTTADMVFAIDELIEQLSAVATLLPGDLIFTGTPAGIGWTRDPRVTLKAGDRLVTHAEIIGELTTTFTTA